MGERVRPNRQILEFQETLDFYSLRDMGYRGPKYTWCNKREGTACISERMDGFMANSTWC